MSERALKQRINRALAQKGAVLRTTRGDRWALDLGRYYVVDLKHNSLLNQHQDLEKLGRELGVLRGYERLVTND